MIAVCVAWLFVGIGAWGYGNLFFAASPGPQNIWNATTGGVAVRIYFGLLVLAEAALFLALLTNVSMWFGLLAVIPGFLLGARDLLQSSTSERTRGTGFLSWSIAAGTMMVLALFLSSREVNFFDTGLYHQQAVKWLSEYGLVRGIALLHVRLGWTSSWYAWAAVLNHGVLEGREAQIIGGMPFALMVATTLAVFWQAWKTKTLPSFESLTLAGFFGLLSAVTAVWNVESSLSADMLIWILPLGVALIASDTRLNGADRYGLALVLAALACNVRPTAAPMLAYSGVLWIWSFAQVPASRKRLMVYLGIATVAVVILASANIKTSGCPLFPSPLGCNWGESSVGPTIAAAAASDIKQFAKQGSRHVSIFLVLSAAASLVAYRLKRKDLFLQHCLVASWCGILFVIATAPNPRFGFGYFLLPAAVCAATILEEVNSWRPSWVKVGIYCAPVLVAVIATFCVVLTVRQMPLVHAYEVPPRMPRSVGDQVHAVNRRMNVRTQLQLSERQAGTVLVLEPQSATEQCWDAPIPCTPQVTVDDLELKSSVHGLAGGFRSEHLLVPNSTNSSHN